MKTIATALVFASLCIAATAAERPVKLTGIARVDQLNLVLLETQHPGGGVLRQILGVGDQSEGIEVVSIDPKAATASLKQDGKVTEFTLGAAGGALKAPTVNCKDADSRQVLDLYQRLSGRTVIASPSLPVARITVKSDVDPAGAVAQALADQDIVVTARFNKFAFATRFSDAGLLEQFKAPPAPKIDPKQEKFPPGLIRFNEADRWQVLDIYQELVGRTLIVSPRLPSAKITVRSETGLTREEAAWLLESALQLAGINATASYDKFAFATAPEDAPRLALTKAPPLPSKDPNVERFRPGLIKFTAADVNQVLEVYQELAGRTLLRAPALPPAPISVKSQTELTREEAVWLLESALQLAGITASTPYDKFAFATAPKDAPRLARIKAPPLPPKDSNVEKFPPGLIKFNDALLDPVLDIYQELAGRKVLRAAALPHLRTTVRSQTELTRDEAAWLLESALQLGGLQFVPAGENQVKVIPATNLNAANN